MRVVTIPVLCIPSKMHIVRIGISHMQDSRVLIQRYSPHNILDIQATGWPAGVWNTYRLDLQAFHAQCDRRVLIFQTDPNDSIEQVGIAIAAFATHSDHRLIRRI